MSLARFVEEFDTLPFGLRRGMVASVLVLALAAPTAALARTISSEASAGRSAGEPAPARAQEPRTKTAQENRSGEALYRRDCAACHGVEGEGSQHGPALVGVGTASVDFQLRTRRMPIAAPNQGLHRPKPEYSPAEIDAIVDHVEPIVAGGPETPIVSTAGADVARGGELYRLHCAACHGTAGVGGALVFSNASAPAVDTASLSPLIVAEAMLVGPGTMPTFSPSPLAEEELRDVVAYVDELQHAEDPGGFHLWHHGPVPEGAVGWILGLGTILLVARWIGSMVGPGQERVG